MNKESKKNAHPGLTDQSMDSLLCFSFEFRNFLVRFSFQIPVWSFGGNVEDVLSPIWMVQVTWIGISM